MKQSAVFLLFCLPLLGVCQTKELGDSAVPSEIKAYLDKTYPAGKKFSYSNEYSALGTYTVAKFENIGADYVVYFDDVKFVSEKKIMDFESIGVRGKMTAFFDQKYGKYKILRSMSVKDTQSSYYEIILLCKCSPDGIYDVKFDQMGELIEATELKDEPDFGN